MKHLIVSFGAKQSGKTSSATAFYGYLLTSLGIFPSVTFDASGKMYIIYDKKSNEGIHFDIDDVSPEMIKFKEKNIWGHIKHVSFADALKESIIRLFGVKREHIYGTDEDKNRLTNVKWANVWAFLSEERKRSLEDFWLRCSGLGIKISECLTIRELCQVFGTDICRIIDHYCHVRSAIDKLIIDDPEYGYIPDGRFDNEFEYFELPETKEMLGDTRVWRVKYTRNSALNNPPGEQGLPEIDESRYDLVIDNKNLTVLEKNEIFINFFIEKGVLPTAGITKS